MASSDTLHQAVSVFLQNGWELKYQMGANAQVERGRLSIPNWAAILTIILFSLLGTIIVSIVKLASGKDSIALSMSENDGVQVMSKRVSLVTHNPAELYALASSAKGLSWGAIWGLGLIVFFVTYFIIS
jgi:hypothetical protein